MPNDEQYAGDLELDFFSSATFEPEVLNMPEENAVIVARNALRVLMMGWQSSVSALMSSRVFNTVFVQRDRELLRGMRIAFQEGFNYIYSSKLENSRFTKQQHNQAQLFLSNCLTILPFADITPYESFNIPQYVGGPWPNGHWEMVNYKVIPIELTPTTGFKTLFINDEDRVFAYGLEPIKHPSAEPHLIFMGTTYPAGQGFITQINTDMEAFETVGKKLYRTGHARIEAWLDKLDGQKPHVCGTSLGGSLALLLAMHHGDKIARVDALNPAGIYEPWRKSRFDKWDECTSKPEVIVQRQANDPVSLFGVWKEDWRVLHVIPPKEKQGPNSLIDHALNYAGLAGTQFNNIDVKRDNDKRRTQSFWLYAIARSLIYYLILIPYRHIIHPVIRYLLNHKLAAVITGVCLVLLFLASPIIWIAPLVATSLISGVIVFETYTHKRHAPLIHDSTLPRNEAMDIHNDEHKINEIFTVQDLHDYYHAKRHVLKEKDPSQLSRNSHVHFKNFSKKEVIEACTPDLLQKEVTIEATKAKIHDIKRTIRLIRRIGFHQPEKLKVELSQEQHDYVVGKTSQKL